MKLTMPATVASQQDLNAVISDVKAYATWVSRELIKQKVVGTSAGTQPAISPEAASVIRDWSAGKPMTKVSVEQLVAELEQYKKNAPLITITLAAVPSGDVRTKLVNWCRKEIAPSTLIHFKLNRAILGGLVVAYGSHVHDWSFRRKLMDAPKPFSEVLQNV